LKTLAIGRKSKTLPLSHTDDTDQKDHRRGRLRSTVVAEVRANLESFGMTSVKAFGILVEAQGGGGYRRDRKGKALPLIYADDTDRKRLSSLPLNSLRAWR
jgi:hypothetical protein